MTRSTPLSASYWPAADHPDLLELTVGDLLRRNAAEVPDRPALVEGSADPGSRRAWTYAELLTSAERVARALLSRFRPGERVAVWAPNRPEWVLLQQGAALAGLVLVTVNPAYRAAEVGYVLRQSRAAGIFHDGTYRDVDMAAAVDAARPDAPALREVVGFDGWDAFLTAGDTDPGADLPHVGLTDPAQVQYTSGTTGFPKGALLHHLGVVNASRFVAVGSGVGDGAVWVNAMPMFHIGGGALTEIGTFAQRGTYVLAPGFDPALLLELVETYRGTITLLVPTMLVAVLDHPDLATRDVSSLQTVMSGASVVPAPLVRRTRDTLGCRVTIVFGQTELHGVVTQTHLDDTPEDQAETIGRPLPHVEVKIVDVATGEVAPPGVQGEICARGYQTMLGYFEMPQDTAAALDDDGWLHLGDLGAMDERGYVTITGRIKDMIIRGGENIYPREIEDCLLAHPGVAAAAVIGVPDDRWGERVAAVFTAADPARPPSAAQLRAHCREHLARYKTPADWYLTGSLPSTATGKTQKFVLRDAVAGGGLVPLAVEDRTADAVGLARPPA